MHERVGLGGTQELFVTTALRIPQQLSVHLGSYQPALTKSYAPREPRRSNCLPKRFADVETSLTSKLTGSKNS